jgi:hypothetical protein
MKSQDGRVVPGVVKEKVQAKNGYDPAVPQGKWAGLVSNEGKLSLSNVAIVMSLISLPIIVFSVSVGAIPVNQEISVNITVSSTWHLPNPQY